MRTVTVTRDNYGSHDTTGLLTVGGFHCFTIERAKDDSAHPCLPLGTYTLSLGTHHFGQPDAYTCYHISNNSIPWGRGFEIHAANVASQLKGCIAVGFHTGVTSKIPGLEDGQRAVFESHAAHDAFMQAMGGDGLGELVIRDAP